MTERPLATPMVTVRQRDFVNVTLGSMVPVATLVLLTIGTTPLVLVGIINVTY